MKIRLTRASLVVLLIGSMGQHVHAANVISFNRIDAVCIPTAQTLQGADTYFRNKGALHHFQMQLGTGASKECYIFADRNGTGPLATSTCVGVTAQQPTGANAKYSTVKRVPNFGLVPRICHIRYNGNTAVQSFVDTLIGANMDAQAKQNRVIGSPLNKIDGLGQATTTMEAENYLNDQDFIQ